MIRYALVTEKTEDTSCNVVETLFFMSVNVKVKVKCTLVQALRLCTGRTAHSESRGIALL